ncbi:hypothetical protein EUX98_g2465 [Antrodiella citrinella]|uniref:RING-type domain-containing protein n=1 Tax=Antrodiella citrinella TaxID=2447956 RepID=A0A4S4N157_9APHY|nr:hypothetical protein EUX98_g2465 [Antrodiella citrinella]
MLNDVELFNCSPSQRPVRSLPRAGPSHKAHKQRPVPVEDVIEITDSEDEPGPSTSRAPGLVSSSSSVWEIDPPPGAVSSKSKAQAQASTSQPQVQEQQPLFLPDLDEPLAGPSRSPKRNLDDAAPPPPPSQTPSRVLETESSAEIFIPPEEDPDPFSGYLAQVLEILPDVDPSHALALITLHHEEQQNEVVATVLQTLFEDPQYPKADKKGKRKREESGEESPSVRQRVEVEMATIDYGNKERPQPAGPFYQDLALANLYSDFPKIPVSHIRREFKNQNNLFAPTYIALDAELSSGILQHKPLAGRRIETGKGKGVLREDPDLELEKAYIAERQNKVDAEFAERLLKGDRVEDDGSGIECGCCFDTHPFDEMIQCPDAHLFCKTCMTSYAESKLGAHDIKLLCMDQSDCKLPFPDSELRRLLTPTLLSLYERIKQSKEIAAAELENLEECPFCEYKVVIENDQEKLFRCENANCGAVSCRQCQKLDHLPKSCKEMEDDKKLDARHAVEEAMSAALMRNCPKCGKGFLKETGCNKMTCPGCATVTCYVCRKVISGYDHFNQQQPPYNVAADNSKCPLWDQVEKRHADEVTAAAKKAIEDYKRLHPDADDKDIHVDLPDAPPLGPPLPGQAIPAVVPPLPHPHYAQAAHHHHVHVHLNEPMQFRMYQPPGLPPAAPQALPQHQQHVPHVNNVLERMRVGMVAQQEMLRNMQAAQVAQRARALPPPAPMPVPVPARRPVRAVPKRKRK